MSDLNDAAMMVNQAVNTANAVIGSSKEEKKSKSYNKWYYENITKPYAEWQLENITKPYYGYQQDKQIEMIGRSLKANMDALKENGINPLMLNGGLELPASAGGSEDSLFQTPAVPDIGSVMSGLGSAASGRAAENLMFSQAAKNFADVGKTQEETRERQTFNEFARELYSGNAKTAQGNYLNVMADVDWKKADIEKIHSAVNNLDAQTQVYNTTCDEIRKNIALMQSQIDVNKSQVGVNDELSNLYAKQAAFYIAEECYSRFKVKLGEEELRVMEAQIVSLTRGASQYAVAEYVEQLIKERNPTVLGGILGDYKTRFYQGEDGEWHYATTTGDLDLLNKKTKGRGALSRGLGLTTGVLDILGVSFEKSISTLHQNTLGRPASKRDELLNKTGTLLNTLGK